jgi:hypothetical protein
MPVPVRSHIDDLGLRQHFLQIERIGLVVADFIPEGKRVA